MALFSLSLFNVRGWSVLNLLCEKHREHMESFPCAVTGIILWYLQPSNHNIDWGEDWIFTDWELWSKMLVVVWGGLREGSAVAFGVLSFPWRGEIWEELDGWKGEGGWAWKTRTNNAGQEGLHAVDTWQEEGLLRCSSALELWCSPGFCLWSFSIGFSLVFLGQLRWLLLF